MPQHNGNGSELQKTQYNQSTDKVIQLIEYLAKAGEPRRLQQISEDLGTNSSTTLRFLTSLLRNGYVAQDEETKQYALTMKICSLSHRLLQSVDIVEVVKPYLKQMSTLFSEVTCLSVKQNNHVIYIATNDGPDQMLKSFVHIGKRAALHCTGTGKLFLSVYTDNELVEYLKTNDNIRLTPNTICTFEELRKELDSIRECHYSIDNEECEIGMRCLAVPIYDYTNKIVAGISVTGPTQRMTDELIRQNLPQLQEVAMKVSEKLGYIAL